MPFWNKYSDRPTKTATQPGTALGKDHWQLACEKQRVQVMACRSSYQLSWSVPELTQTFFSPLNKDATCTFHNTESSMLKTDREPAEYLKAASIFGTVLPWTSFKPIAPLDNNLQNIRYYQAMVSANCKRYLIAKDTKSLHNTYISPSRIPRGSYCQLLQWQSKPYRQAGNPWFHLESYHSTPFSPSIQDNCQSGPSPWSSGISKLCNYLSLLLTTPVL